MAVQLRDNLTPALRKLAAGITNKRPILEAMGLQLESLTKRAFNEPNLRPAPWANKLTMDAEGRFSRTEPSRLRKNQLLVRSIRITALTNTSVTVGTDRIYAAVHQFGAVIRPKSARALAFKLSGQLVLAQKVTIPARPFFPWIGGSMVQAAQDKIRKIAEAKIRSLTKT